MIKKMNTKKQVSLHNSALVNIAITNLKEEKFIFACLCLGLGSYLVGQLVLGMW
jgi:hypothetical protein